MSFQDYCDQLKVDDGQKVSINKTFVISFSNKNGKVFSLDPSTAVAFLEFLDNSHASCQSAWEAIPSKKPTYTQYEEKSYRAIFKIASSDAKLIEISTLGGSQSNQLTRVLSKLVCYLGGFEYEGVETNTRFDQLSVRAALEAVPANIEELAGIQAHSASESFESRFKEWLRSNNVPENTISKYTKDTPRLINRLLINQGAVFSGLFYVKSTSDLDLLKGKLEVIPEWTQLNQSGNGMYSSGVSKYKAFLEQFSGNYINLAKPFLLLAGISGTGKTRFIRRQAELIGNGVSNYQLIPVRPDWHEPSDLLGYVSRIDGEKYVPTPLLKFIAEAWRQSVEQSDGNSYTLKPLESITPYWACLDEMNLAPVEQYFADYLSVLETRKWEGDVYSCDALLHPGRHLSTGVCNQLRQDLGFDEESNLWKYFVKHGLPLPPNLIVAGTVNMDETTHGFSRKVIDRAFTIDFGEFFPNKFLHFFEPDTLVKTFTYSKCSSVTRDELLDVAADSNGNKSIIFLQQVNDLLTGTPFELAFRALNELLVSLKCFAPFDDRALHAVWDDFLMGKVLPRLEGDAEKLRYDGETSLLTKLNDLLHTRFSEGGIDSRPDLFRTLINGDALNIDFRSLKKLSWMQSRLEANGFTSFWP